MLESLGIWQPGYQALDATWVFGRFHFIFRFGRKEVKGMNEQENDNSLTQCDVFEVDETTEKEYLSCEIVGSIGAQ
ncbi:hypothetical protein CEB3_c10350 [Peptococcaceae bacterium CEB3]|nr:hypothetical protein CEB3_c10350 [Peptococcaceae bacterium CEB3]